MGKQQIFFESFKNIQELIRFIDQKANFLVLAYGIVMGFFVNSTKELNIFIGFKKYIGYKFFISCILFLMGAFIIIISLYFVWILLFKVIKPRYPKVEVESSYFFYASILQKPKLDYIKEVRNLEYDGNEIIDGINSQIYEVSKVLKEKSINLEKAINGLFCLIALVTVFCILEKII